MNHPTLQSGCGLIAAYRTFVRHAPRCLAGLAMVYVALLPCALSGQTITSLSPTSGAPGVQVTISGSGFGSAQGTGTVVALLLRW
jgi:hypothetical protein